MSDITGIDTQAAEVLKSVIGQLDILPEDARLRVLAAVAIFYGYELREERR